MDELTDLVRDWKLESIIGDNDTTHIKHVSDPAKGIWRVRTEEKWTHVRDLGSGTYGDVRLEECTMGPCQGRFRAVKELRKPAASVLKTSLSGELKAIFKFSHERVTIKRFCLL